MTLTPLKSSNVAGYAYNAATATLYIAYKSGGLYSYAGVPAHVANGLTQVRSVGKYVHRAIKGTYPFEKIKQLPSR